MIRINIKQLRKIVQEEMSQKRLVESGDNTSDALATLLAEGIKKQLSGDLATRVVTDFFSSGRDSGMLFPTKIEDVTGLKSEVAQKVMTRLGSDLQAFVESVVTQAVSHQSKGVQAESAEKDELPSDYEQCGTCGFDHEYEYAEAQAWHKEHPEGN